MNNYQITARHAGLGTITFVIEGEDKKRAFEKWKQVVYSCKQWTIRMNEEVLDGRVKLPASDSFVSGIAAALRVKENDDL